jgi:hypothetical protein|tara:strand:+ start:376 stop:495 length:120 start_codon:yes stop_codon:yes gene_type:complete
MKAINLQIVERKIGYNYNPLIIADIESIMVGHWMWQKRW